jgi:bifunctional DNase/RNase
MAEEPRKVTVVEITEALQQHGKAITTHIVNLQDEIFRNFHLPLGPCEAWAIKLALSNDLLPRPMTHDLIQAIVERLGGSVEYVLIRRAGKGWKGEVRLSTPDGSRLLQANHGDAIALALRANAAILATEEVITSEELPPGSDPKPL